jgi:hypothetical protein
VIISFSAVSTYFIISVSVAPLKEGRKEGLKERKNNEDYHDVLLQSHWFK